MTELNILLDNGTKHLRKPLRKKNWDYDAGVIPSPIYDKSLSGAAAGLTDTTDPENTKFKAKDNSDRPVDTQLGTVVDGVRVITDSAEIKKFIDLLKK